MAVWGRDPLDDAVSLQRSQAMAEQCRRHARAALLDLAEGVGAQVNVAKDEGRPALGEDLGGLRDRAVVAVAASHAVSSLSSAGPEGNCRFCRRYGRRLRTCSTT